ncbi:MAG: Holliday junction resolvase RuvX [Acidimicrobiales bacterium]
MSPPGARALGLDLGERRIGVAVTDSGRTLAVPLCTIERNGKEHGQIRDLVDEMGIGVVVVGLPKSLDGRIGPAARSISHEAHTLADELKALGVDVVMHDERFTTVEANRALAGAGKRSRDRRKVVDQTAACVMLQAWLGG